MPACNCSEKKRPLYGDLPRGSNDRPRQWFVLKRNERHYRSPGRFGTHWSAYSWVACRVCGGHWKTKADFVVKLQNSEFFPCEHEPKVEAFAASPL